MSTGARRATFERLKQELAAQETTLCVPTSTAVSLGDERLDAAIPGGGLAPGLHELRADTYFDTPAAAQAAMGFVARLAAARAGPIVWCRPRGGGAHDFGAPDPGAFVRFGINPARVLLVQANDVAGVLWAMEEGARTPGVAAVLGEAGPARTFDLTAGRRLHLAAQRTGAPVLAWRSTGAVEPSPALTRWCVAAAPGPPAAWRGSGALQGLGLSRVRLMLERRRGGAGTVCFEVEWDDATDCFRLAAALADRPRPATRSLEPVRRAS